MQLRDPQAGVRYGAAFLLSWLSLTTLPALATAQVPRAPAARQGSFGDFAPGSSNRSELARVHLVSGQRELKRARKATAKSARLHGEKRDSARRRAARALEVAAREFRAVLEFDPDSIAAWTGLGSAMQQLGHSKDALAIYANGLRVAPEDDALFAGWVTALIELSMIDEATQACETLRRRKPRRADMLLTGLTSWLEAHRESEDPTTASKAAGLETWLKNSAN